MAIATGSKLGVDLANASSTQQFTLGDRTSGTQDTMWVYVEMSGAATTGQIVTINTNSTATRALTSAGQGAGGSLVGFAQSAFTSGQFGWVCYHGNNVYVACSGTTSPSGTLYVATTSGLVHTTSASSTLAGVVLLAASSASATANPVLANLTWPRFLTNLG